MKVILATLAAAGISALFAMPANADATATPNGVSNTATATTVEHADISARRRHWHHYGYHYRPHRYWGPRFGYYRPYRYYGPFGYAPGVSLGFWGGPRVGVWF